MHQQLRIKRANRRPRYQWLRHGRAGNVQTLREMSSLVREDVSTDLGLQDFANEILLRAGVRGNVRRPLRAEIEALFNFLRYDPRTKRGVIFRRDPIGGESIQDARETLGRGFGDCDDFAVCLGTLLGLAGYPSRFVVIRVNESTKDGFDHVYLETPDPEGRGWLALDPTNEKALVGWEEPRPIERRTFAIYSDDPDSTDLAGFLSTLKSIGKGIAKVGRPFVAAIPGVGPFADAGLSIVEGAVAANKQSKAQKELRQQFDQLAKDTSELFNSIEQPGRKITEADAQRAEQGLQQLVSFAQQTNDQKIVSQLTSPAYLPAYKRRLEAIIQKAQVTAAAEAAAARALQSGGYSNAPGGQGGGLGNIDPKLLIGGAAALVLLPVLLRR